ncbi:MAG TPA: hypothetical protein VIC28_01420 [Thermoanaerobaculia bacterium]|jgi:hypothetical protein
MARTNASQKTLETRVRTLETYFKVVLTVAAIVGIGTGFLGNAFLKAQEKIEILETDAKAIQDQIDTFDGKVKEIGENAVKAISAAGGEQRASLQKMLESISPGDLAKGILHDGVRDVLVRDCGDDECACPEGWQRAKSRGGDGDLNNKARGNFIYLCVQRY